MTTEQQQRVLDAHRRFCESERGAAPVWLRQIRANALARFASLGFPKRRGDEAWKYTNVTPLLKRELEWAPGSVLSGMLPSVEPLGTLAHLVNGTLDRTGRASELPAGVTIARSDQLPDHGESLLFPIWSRFVDLERNPFALLNSAFCESAVVVQVAAGVRVAEPIHLVYDAACGEGTVLYPRLVVCCERGSQVTVIEEFRDHAQGAPLVDAVTEFEIGENASVTHYKVQADRSSAAHIWTARVQIGRDSTYRNELFNFGASLVRNTIGATLAGSNVTCTLNGLNLVKGRSHVDNHTVIAHRRPHGNSHQLYKGVIDDEGTHVFNGQIHVHQDAQKTDAKQSNQNLLLSRGATVNTKPQLEILADDVKCTHGATVGQLDANALFYLRARGIDVKTARAMLIGAFAAELVDAVTVEALQHSLRVAVERWMARESL